MSWMNSDGLYVKFSKEEGDSSLGGAVRTAGGVSVVEVDIPYTELLSATNAIVGSVGKPGSFGVTIPEGVRIQAVETLVTTAFTSSGTVGTATLVLGLKKASDRSTELDHDGFLTTSYVGSKLDAVGERNYQEVGTTGSGALIGTTISENGVLSASNSQHGSHPYTAGEVKVRIYYFAP